MRRSWIYGVVRGFENGYGDLCVGGEQRMRVIRRCAATGHFGRNADRGGFRARERRIVGWMLIVFITKVLSGLGQCFGQTEAWGFGMNGRKDTKKSSIFYLRAGV
jgi:hypothetical protein